MIYVYRDIKSTVGYLTSQKRLNTAIKELRNKKLKAHLDKAKT